MDKQKHKIVIDGVAYHTYYNKAYENRATYKKENPKELHSIIPGVVTEVLVQASDVVKKNQVLLIVEAMKMCNRLVAKSDGVVKRVNVTANQVIPKNCLLVEFE